MKILVQICIYFFIFISKILAIDLYVGTSNNNVKSGIYKITIDSKQQIQEAKLVTKALNPSYIVINNNYLFSVNEVNSYNGMNSGYTSVYQIDNNKLNLIDQQSTTGANPTHLAVDTINNYLYIANYGNNTNHSAGMTVYKISPQGKLTWLQYNPYQGHGIDQDRQASAHTHGVYTFQSNLNKKAGQADTSTKILVSDLGLDKIFTYQLDVNVHNNIIATPQLIATNDITGQDKKNGVGVRHLVMAKNNNIVYVIDELQSKIFVYKFDNQSGKLSFLQSIDAFNGALHADRDYPSEGLISIDNKYLYVSNRGQNTIAMFTIDPNGLLTYLTEYSAGGNFPRDIAINNDGTIFAIANQKSNNVAIYDIDKSGNLINLRTVTVPTPTSVKFTAK